MLELVHQAPILFFFQPVTDNMAPLILTQAPLPVTYSDFWTMVVEQQVEVVVCLLSDIELGGHVYWPVDKTRDLTLGKMRLSLQTCNVRQHWVERIISVNMADGKTSRVVVHLQFTSWPGRCVCLFHLLNRVLACKNTFAIIGFRRSKK